MTLVHSILLLSAFCVTVLVGYILVMLFEWHREDEPNEHWPTGCRIRTAHDPHHFLPGVWRTSARYNDGTAEWERIA